MTGTSAARAAEVAAKLAEIREQAEKQIAFRKGQDDPRHWPEYDMPALLDAVDAVLELAGEWAGQAVTLDAMSERSAARGGDPLRITLMGARAQAHEDCARALREVISRALLGQEAADGS